MRSLFSQLVKRQRGAGDTSTAWWYWLPGWEVGPHVSSHFRPVTICSVAVLFVMAAGRQRGLAAVVGPDEGAVHLPQEPELHVALAAALCVNVA